MTSFNEHEIQSLRNQRYPIRWLTYKGRLRDDVTTAIGTEGGKEFFNKDYIERLINSAKQLEDWEIKLLTAQLAIVAFFLVGFTSDESSISLFGISLKQASGLKEVLLAISSSLLVLSLFFNAAKEAKLTIVEAIIKATTDEKYREFAEFAAPASFHLRVYVARQFERWVFPMLPTRITFGIIVTLLVIIFAAYFLFSILISLYIFLDVYKNPTLGTGSSAVLAYVVCVYVLAGFWIIRTQLPLPFRDQSALKKAAELQRLDPIAYEQLMRELYSSGNSVTSRHPMRPPRTLHLVLAVLAITVLAHILVALRLAGYPLPFRVDFFLAWLLILSNLAVAVAGWWTSHRVAWMIYLVLSIAGLVLIGAATPITAVWLLGLLFFG